MRKLLIAIVLWAFVGQAAAAVFQWSVPAQTEKSPSAAFLWIPPQARQVRGVVMGGMTLIERELAQDAQIRKACADEQLAIVFLKCGLGAVNIQAVLDDLAKASGYPELSQAPLFFVGHSAGGPQAKALAIRMAGRCFGLMQYRGGIPGGGEPVPPGIPALMMVGQFDEFGGKMRDENGRENAWESGTAGIASFRAANEANLGSIVVEAGAGHFAWSERNAAYLAMFLRKAAKARIPEQWPIDAKEPPALKAIDHTAGWLTNLTIRNAAEFEPAPYNQFKGPKGAAAWHFDEEMARATVAFHQGFGKKDQFIKWNDPYYLDAGVRCFFSKLQWVDDGRTFEVHPVYRDSYPATQPGGRWAEAGKPAGHSSAPILVRRVSGPLEVGGPNRLRIVFDNLSPATEASRPTFMAYSVGDAEYRHTEQVGMMPRGFAGLKAGRDQTITFPPIGNLKVGWPPVELKATSDADLKVEYYVAYGPAEVMDGKLIVAELPARARLPVPVKVVAWQFGRGMEPLVKTAAPVEQTIQVGK